MIHLWSYFTFIIRYFHWRRCKSDLFVKTRLFKDNTNDFIVKTYYNILPASPDADFKPPSPANWSDLPFSPDAEFESPSPSNLSDLPFSPDPDFKPPSPANQSDLPVDDESSLAESPTAGQNLSNPLDISFQVINNCTNKASAMASNVVEPMQPTGCVP